MKMTYKNLMKKVDEGAAEINAWTNDDPAYPVLADVTFYNSRGQRREHVEVTNIPADIN